MAKKELEIYACMKCGSKDLNSNPGGVFSAQTAYGMSGAMSGNVLCNACGQYGMPLIFTSETVRERYVRKAAKRRNIFIIHGVEGYPEENWFPWLKSELEKLGCNVIVPQFPTPAGQTLANWLETLDGYKQYLTEDTILVGHSLGSPFILNVLENQLAHAAFLVAGFTGKVENAFDDGMKTFAQRDFNWQKIMKNCAHFYVFQSGNDPYIKLEKGKELAKNLCVEPTIVNGAGHFNTKAGYTSFPLLLQMIKKEL